MSTYSSIITRDQLVKCMPGCKDPEAWAEHLNQKLFMYGIIGPERVAMFIAQCGHESLDFNVLEENLNYSGDRLLVVFPKYFRGIDVSRYHRRPAAIANRVYANRMGNGSEASGDGYRYRGRGIIQITGRNNYTACSRSVFGSDILVTTPEYMSTDKHTAVLGACWYWEQMGLKKYTDINRVTRLINGGLNGIEDRTKRYFRALAVLNGQ